jgi:hypothetical protein
MDHGQAGRMKTREFTPEQIITTLMEAEVLSPKELR